jgi:chloramphenicol 3-O-phosphotransferase
MKLVFIHGAPATGKLTVAKELLKVVAGRLLENHAAIDFARTIFDFGAPGFWELIHDVRLAAIAAAARQDVPLIAMTFCYSHPNDLRYFEQFESLMREERGELLPVYLHCSDQEIARRIGNADRIERRKTSSMQALTSFRRTYNDAPVPSADCLRLDTETATAEATAREIIRRFHLDSDSAGST